VGKDAVLHPDTFDTSKKININLSDFNTVATRKRFTSEQGVAYVKRPLLLGCKNIFRIKILHSEQMSINIGIDRVQPKAQFEVSMKLGMKQESG